MQFLDTHKKNHRNAPCVGHFESLSSSLPWVPTTVTSVPLHKNGETLVYPGIPFGFAFLVSQGWMVLSTPHRARQPHLLPCILGVLLCCVPCLLSTVESVVLKPLAHTGRRDEAFLQYR